jgi:Cft2 family RNA processing exonuclease
MFHYDGGLKLTRIDLAIDFRRRQPRGFVSHAHFDHLARHELAFCTPATGALYRLRLGQRPVQEMPYATPLEWEGLVLTTLPAGHCLGSAMLLAEHDGCRLLYTGDFKLRPSATAGAAELPHADVLILECTYGDPRYRFIPRAQAAEQLVAGCQAALRRGATPVVQAYPLGKAQEVTHILTAAGLGVLQHALIYEISCVYEEFGVGLGPFAPYEGRPLENHALIIPPGPKAAASLRGVKKRVTFAVTGWASDAGTARRWNADRAIVLSDHADFEELLEAVGRVRPRQVFCTHGPETFAEHLREAGYDAHYLGRQSQLRLF